MNNLWAPRFIGIFINEPSVTKSLARGITKERDSSCPVCMHDPSDTSWQPNAGYVSNRPRLISFLRIGNFYWKVAAFAKAIDAFETPTFYDCFSAHLGFKYILFIYIYFLFIILYYMYFIYVYIFFTPEVWPRGYSRKELYDTQAFIYIFYTKNHLNLRKYTVLRPY